MGSLSVLEVKELRERAALPLLHYLNRNMLRKEPSIDEFILQGSAVLNKDSILKYARRIVIGQSQLNFFFQSTEHCITSK